MENLDIKSLTRELKRTVDNHESAPKEKTSPNPEIKQKRAPRIKRNTLEALFAETNNRKDFDTNACVYIDSEIHDVLRQLKARKKLNMGPFISSLIEKFILDHKEEIIYVLKRKANRFTGK